MNVRKHAQIYMRMAEHEDTECNGGCAALMVAVG